MDLSLPNHYTSIHNWKIYIQQERTNLLKIIECSINYPPKIHPIEPTKNLIWL